MDNNFSIYIPFDKTDSDQRIVAGVASSEALDSQGEVVKFEAIKKALPDYMKFANLREMHQNSAVGKTVKAVLDEKNKQLHITGKIIDDMAWKKVKEGVYNGFSIGGRVLKQIGNEIFDLALTEISVVDRPANPKALFSLVKFDNTEGGDTMKDIKKDDSEDQADEGADQADKKPDHMEVFRAANLLSIAADLCMLYDMYDMNGMDATNLDKAVELLKQVVAQEMAGSEGNTSDAAKQNKETAQKVLDTLDAFQKRKLTAEDRKDLKDSDFAYIDSKGGKHLPLHDKEHVQHAITRFDQIGFESEEVKRTSAKKIILTAKREGVEIDSQSSILTVAKRADFTENKFIIKSDSWVNGYFDQMQKVLG